MLKALICTITELLDSKKAAYSFLASVGASVLHLYFDVSVQDALLLVSPLGVATLSQAHVDAAIAKSGKALATQAGDVAPAVLPIPTLSPGPSVEDPVTSADAKTETSGDAKTDG